MRTDRQTDRHDDVNCHLSQFCEDARKQTLNERRFVPFCLEKEKQFSIRNSILWYINDPVLEVAFVNDTGIIQVAEKSLM
jgi:hypothetical protein